MVDTEFQPRWRSGWLSWLLFFLALEIPAALNKKKNDTLSENTWQVLNSWMRRIVFLLFWNAVGIHLVFKTSVTPVILLGLPVGYYFIVTSYQQYQTHKGKIMDNLTGSSFRWDKWFGALLYALVSAILAGGVLSYIQDGLTGPEIVAIISLALTTAGGYMKQHPPKFAEYGDVTDENDENDGTK